MIASGAQERPSTVRKFPKVKPYAYAIVLPTGIFVIAAPREVHRCYAPYWHVTIATTGSSALSPEDEHHPHHRRRACGKRSGMAGRAGGQPRRAARDAAPPDDRSAYRRGLGRAGVLEFVPLRRLGKQRRRAAARGDAA